MLPLLLALLPPLLPQQPAADAPEAAAEAPAPLPIAVLESGRRVECTAEAAPGDRYLATPFGRLDAALDPVAEIADGAAEAALLRKVRGTEPEAWVKRASERGFLSEMVEAARGRTGELPEPAADALLSELESWGVRLDPVPAKIAFESRVAWLWDAVQGADPAMAALLGGRLAAEIPGPSAPFKQRLGLVELRKALKDHNPGVRRAAALVSRRQHEFDMRPNLLQSSLEDPAAEVRLASANTMMAIDQTDALGRWTLSFWRGKDEAERNRAVEHLGRHGNENTVEALVMALAAAQSASSGHRGESAFAFFGRQISYVADVDVQVAQAAVIADPVVGVISDGSVLYVRVMSSGTVRTVMGALGRLTGASPGPAAADWLKWYEEQRAAKS